MPPRRLHLLPQSFAITRLPAGTPLPDWLVWDDPLVSVTTTSEEVSILCPLERLPSRDRETAAGPWRAFKVEGPLDFAETGILLGLAEPLYKAGVSIFAVSTFDTDYVLVTDAHLAQAKAALSGRYQIVEAPGV